MTTQIHGRNWLDNESAQWWIVNDTVMGGRSQSELLKSREQGFIRFMGNLSLQNNGGFASTRSLTEQNFFGNTDKICLEVRGDGRAYQLRLRSNRNFDGYAYVKQFQTINKRWIKLSFELSEFEASFRGRTLTGVPQITAKEIRQVGFLLGDKKPGKFQLDFRYIGNCLSTGV